MQSRSHAFLFLLILILVGGIWAGLYFWTDKTAPSEQPYGVVQSVRTEPSSQELVGSYASSLESLVAAVSDVDDCVAVKTVAEEQLSGMRVPKEFLDDHLQAFLQSKQQTETVECVQEIRERVALLAQAVSSTEL